MLKDTLAWRKSYRPHAITPDEVQAEALTGKVYPNGHDKAGRPILILCPGRENTRTPQRQCACVGERGRTLVTVCD
jgi:hypothetical protein